MSNQIKSSPRSLWLQVVKVVPRWQTDNDDL
jgi:hypothetical protein